jgi:hypothetical protein
MRGSLERRLQFNDPHIRSVRISMKYLEMGSRGSSVSIVSDLRIGRPGFDPRQGQRIFLLAPASRLALGPTQPPVQWVPGGKARPRRDADQSPLSSAEVKNE